MADDLGRGAGIKGHPQLPRRVASPGGLLDTIGGILPRHTDDLHIVSETHVVRRAVLPTCPPHHHLTVDGWV